MDVASETDRTGAAMPAATTRKRKTYTAAEKERFAAERKAKLAAIHERLEAGVTAMSSSDGWLAYLATAAKFHRYSPNNVMLILAQRPDATQVAGFRKWQELGRQVRKGEKGIVILAPSTRKVTDEDPDTGEERTARTLVGFRGVSVFDISQTDGEPLPEPPRWRLPSGEVDPAAFDVIADHLQSIGYAVTVEEPDSDNAAGTTNYSTMAVKVKPGLDAAGSLHVLAHEAGHAILHHPDDPDHPKDLGTCEVEAESVAFIVLSSLGLDPTGHSHAYLTRFSGGEPEAIRKTAGRVLRAAGTLVGLLTGDTDGAELEAEAAA